MNETDSIEQKTLKLQQELIRTEQSFLAFEQIKTKFQQIDQQLRELREYLTQFPDTAVLFQKKLQEAQVLPRFYNYKNQLLELQGLLRETSDKTLTQAAFLETNRSYRHYFFASHSDTIAFLQKLAEQYTLSHFQFKPHYMGYTVFTTLEQQNVLSKTKSDTWNISPANLQTLFSFLREKKFASNFRLDSDEIKILMKNPQNLKIDTAPDKVRRIDILARNANAEISNE